MEGYMFGNVIVEWRGREVVVVGIRLVPIARYGEANPGLRCRQHGV